MNEIVINDESPAWFKEPGPDQGIVVSSRIRLSRNLADHLYPHSLQDEESRQVRQSILEAFGRIGGEDGGYEVFDFSHIQPIDKKIMLENNLITQEYSLRPDGCVLLSKDRKTVCMLNEIDHLRLASFQSGFDLEASYRAVDALDSSLEQHLEYAVSLDYGYLNTEITNVGTGLRGSLMFHLPALVETGLIDKALKSVMQIGFSIKGFMSDDEDSLGDMYQLSNQTGLGSSEEQQIAKLNSVAEQLIRYEQQAREELLDKKKTQLEDRIYRAYGILSYCRAISSAEAIRLLSDLRLGIAMGQIVLPFETITSLFFYVQKHHIQKLMGLEDENSNTTLIDYYRAKFIRSSLRGAVLKEDFHV